MARRSRKKIQAPEYFDENGEYAWECCLKILKTAHGSVELFLAQVEMVCWEYQQWKIHQRGMLLDSNEGISETPNGYSQISARSNLMNRHFTSFISGCKNLGITPSFIARNKLIEKQDEEDEFEDYKKR